MIGHFSVRGGILDVYSPEAAYPVRIEMFGDEVESIREFDPDTQKSVRSVDQASLLPLAEYPLFRQAAAPGPEESGGPAAGGTEEVPILAQGWEFRPEAARHRSSSVLELLDDPILVWNEPAAVRDRADQLWAELAVARERGDPESPPPETFYLPWDDFLKQTAAKQQVHLDQLGLEAAEERLEIPTQRTPRFQGNMAHCIRELQAQVKSGYRAVVVAASLGDVERLAEIFGELGINYKLGIKNPSKASSPYLEEKAYLAGPVTSTVLVQGAIREGAVFPDSHTIIYGSEDLFSDSVMVARPERR
jgi:transcription-repair coupling factor (superfamily II helicase)